MDEYPYRHRHHHRNRDDDRNEEEDYPPPPQPPNYQQDFNPVQAHHHYAPHPNFNNNYGGDIGLGYQGGPPPPPSSNYNYDHPRFESAYPAPPPAVHHVSHEINYQPPSPPRQQPQHGNHHIPSFINQHTHEPELMPNNNNNKPSVRVYTKAENNYSLTIRDGQVVLEPSDPRDDFQHWIKDDRHGIRVKDAEGFPSFALVNKATGQAIKHSFGATQPVQLIPYNPNVFDESILWTESKDLGDSFRCIRMVNNIRLNLDAFNGDKNHGGVRDGTVVVLWEWKKGDNQRWKIAPY